MAPTRGATTKRYRLRAPTGTACNLAWLADRPMSHTLKAETTPAKMVYATISQGWPPFIFSNAVAMSGVLIGFHKPERYIGR